MSRPDGPGMFGSSEGGAGQPTAQVAQAVAAIQALIPRGSNRAILAALTLLA